MEHSIEPAAVLLVDDDPAIRELAVRTLGETHPHLDVTTRETPEAALEHLEAASVDCVVTDYAMPGTDGLEFVEAVRERDPDLPVVFFTGKGSEELASEAIAAGVTDYIRKERGARAFELLASRIETLVRIRRAEATAAEADRRVRELFDRVSDAVLSLDDEGRVTYLNAGAESMFGELSKLDGERLVEAVPSLEDSTFVRLLDRASEVGETTAAELDLSVPDGDRTVSVTAYPATDGMSVFVRDLTALREREAEIEELTSELDGAESRFRTLTKKLSRPHPPNR